MNFSPETGGIASCFCFRSGHRIWSAVYKQGHGNIIMKYYYNTVLRNQGFHETVQKVIEALKKEKFGVLTTIDLKATFKKKLEVDFRNYVILGACNPPFAYKALQAEDKIGTLLPCNVIVQEKEAGLIEVSAVNPMVSMQGVDNDSLEDIATEVAAKLQNVISSL